MIQPEEVEIANLKFLLLCFESMSGLRINFHKSEVMVLGITSQEQSRTANMLNCKQGPVPFTYLGLPIRERAITTTDLGPVMMKLARKAYPWIGKIMSLAARFILINACLSIFLCTPWGCTSWGKEYTRCLISTVPGYFGRQMGPNTNTTR
jgi:hypothetical protein